jgi:hypothetical protein
LSAPLGLRWIPAMFRSTYIVGMGGVFVIALFATWAAFTVMGARRVALLYAESRLVDQYRHWDANASPQPGE